MATEPDNFQRLGEAGIIRTDDFPDEYRAVIDGLDEAEVSVLLDVWGRLQATGGEEAELRPGEEPRWTTYMWF